MRVYKFQLEPTATYKQRSCLWFTGVGSGDGVLSVTVVHGKAYKLEQDVYGVEETPSTKPDERCFQMVRITEQRGEAPQEQPYVVTIGRQTRCTCDAGRMGFRRNSCKHAEALQALVETGQLPPRPTPAETWI